MNPTFKSLALAFLISENVFSDAHGVHERHEHDSTRHKRHLRNERRLNLFDNSTHPGGNGLCKDGDANFTIGGVTYECEEDFNSKGGQCRTQERTPAEKEKARQDFLNWKENKGKGLGNGNGNGNGNGVNRRHRALGGCPNSDCVNWATQVITIPTYFHIIYDGTTGEKYVFGKNPGYIIESIKVMNNGYRGKTTTMSQITSRSYARYLEGDIDSKIQFCLQGTTATNNKNWYADSDELGYKAALDVGGLETLNIFVNTASGYLGYAYFPRSSDFPEDGVVIVNDSMPGPGPNQANSDGGIYGYGDTLTHEVGHWLGLDHTHELGCSGPGDYMIDAPASAHYTSKKSCESKATFNCPINLNNCAGDLGVNPIHNFMSYAEDRCMDEFSPGQKVNLQAAWETYRHKPGYSENFSLSSDGYSCVYNGATPGPSPLPTSKPTAMPVSPTSKPTLAPTSQPTSKPTPTPVSPTSKPTLAPTSKPTTPKPTAKPTRKRLL